MIVCYFAGQQFGNANKFWTYLNFMEDVRVNKSIKQKLPSFSAGPHLRKSKIRSNLPWKYQKSYNTRSIWDYHHWWEKNKKTSFNYIKERVWKKIQGWKDKLLSQAGREILIKAVVQAIPTYTMSCFKLPLGLCGDIESLIRKFWWGQKGDRRKVHWVKWDTLCKPKLEGGMGFKDLANFNDALLAKQAWRLLHQKNSLLYRVFKARFFPNCSILEASYSSSWSYAWHSILKGRDLLLKGARWRVGCGDAISVWNDAWLPSKTHPRIESQVVSGLEELKVSALIDPTTKKWDHNMLNGLFTPLETELILSIPLCQNTVEDTVVWPFTPSRTYTVRSGTRFLTADHAPIPQDIPAQPDKEVWKLIWSLNVQNKVRNFLWRTCHNALPVKQNLKRRHILNDDVCDLCKQETESVFHSLWSCAQLTQV